MFNVGLNCQLIIGFLCFCGAFNLFHGLCSLYFVKGERFCWNFLLLLENLLPFHRLCFGYVGGMILMNFMSLLSWSDLWGVLTRLCWESFFSILTEVMYHSNHSEIDHYSHCIHNFQ